MHGGDEDDFTALALFDHLARRNLAGDECAIEIDGEDAVPFLVGDVEKWPLDLDAGIADDDVEPTEFCHDLLNHALDVGTPADIAGKRCHVRAHFGRDRLRALRIELASDSVIKPNVSAFR